MLQAGKIALFIDPHRKSTFGLQLLVCFVDQRPGNVFEHLVIVCLTAGDSVGVELPDGRYQHVF